MEQTGPRESAGESFCVRAKLMCLLLPAWTGPRAPGGKALATVASHLAPRVDCVRCGWEGWRALRAEIQGEEGRRERTTKSL